MFFKELSAHLAVRHPNIALPSVLTIHYCIPQEWQTVLHQICSTTDGVKVLHTDLLLCDDHLHVLCYVVVLLM